MELEEEMAYLGKESDVDRTELHRIEMDLMEHTRGIHPTLRAHAFFMCAMAIWASSDVTRDQVEALFKASLEFIPNRSN